MPKHFVVQLEKADGTVVANSQIITVFGLGDGNIVASNFVDGSLYGAVSTSSRSAVIYKTLTPSSSTISTSIFDPYFESCCCNDSDWLRIFN